MPLPLTARRLTALLVLGLASPAIGAEARPDRAALKRSCGGDYATYCGDLAPDGPEVQACFRKNMASLSPACRAEIDRQGNGGRKG